MSIFGCVSIGRSNITIGIETVGMISVDIPIDNTVVGGGSVAMVVVVLVGVETILWSRGGGVAVVGIVPIGMLSIGMVNTIIVDILGLLLLLDASVILNFLLVDLIVLWRMEPIFIPAAAVWICVSGFTGGRRRGR